MAKKPIAIGVNDDDSLTRISTEDDNGALVFEPESTERMRIDSSGNVGIGTSSPTSFLDVRASGTSIPSTISLVGTNSLGSDSCISQIKSLESSAGSGSSELSFHTRAVGGAFATPTERMRIDSSGNLLVGTTSAKGKAVVKGNFAIEAGNYSNGNIQHVVKTFTGNTTYANVFTKGTNVQGVAEVTIYTAYGTPTSIAGILRLLALPDGTVSVLSQEGNTGSNGTGGIQYQWSGNNFQTKTSNIYIYYTVEAKLVSTSIAWPVQS